GDLEPVGVADGERPIPPRRLGRLAVERPTVCLDPAGQLADVLRRRDPQPEPLTLLAVPTLGEVVLPQHDVAGAGLILLLRGPPPDYSTTPRTREHSECRPVKRPLCGKGSSRTARARSRRAAAPSVGPTVSRPASRASRARTPRSSSPRPTPHASAWRSRR